MLNIRIFDTRYQDFFVATKVDIYQEAYDKAMEGFQVGDSWKEWQANAHEEATSALCNEEPRCFMSYENKTHNNRQVPVTEITYNLDKGAYL